MRKIIFLALFLIAFNKQYAQIEKGTYVPSVALSANYTNQQSKDSLHSNASKNYGAGFNFGFGRFIKENLLLGATLNYNYTYYKNSIDYVQNIYSGYSYDQNRNTVGLGFSLLKYKFISENFAVRFGPSASVSFSDGFNTQSGYHYYNQPYKIAVYQNSISFQINLQAGIQYFVSRELALMGNMGFFTASYTSYPYLKEKKHTDQNGLSVSLSPSFNFFNVGLTYYFRPKTTQ